MDRGAWQAIVHGVAKSRTRLSDFTEKMKLTSLVAPMVKRLPTMRETQVRSLGREDPLAKEMATHSSTLAWKTPWTENLVGYSPWGRKEPDTTERLHFRFLQGASSAVLLHLQGHRAPGSSSVQRCPGAQPLPCPALQPAAPQTPPPRLHPRCLHTPLQFYSRVPPVIKTTASEHFSFTLQRVAFYKHPLSGTDNNFSTIR